MKKALKILLIGLLSVLCILTVVACNQNNVPATEPEIDETFEYDGTYDREHTNAFGYAPDLEDVVIDGHFDEEIWQNKKWYTNYKIQNPNFKFEVTTHMTDGGLYIAAKSNDKGIFFSGRNYFFYNTHVRLYFPQFGAKIYDIDVNGLPPTHDTVNVRSRYEGTLNANNGGEGFFVEGYFTWQQLGASKRPEEPVLLLPSYYWVTKPNSANHVLLSTFVSGNGSSAQALKFDENGYIDADDEKATVGSHSYGLGKTNGWKVENPGEENETVIANNTYGKGYAKAIFFRNLRSNRYMLKTRVTVHGNEGTGRAGLLMYCDNVNYRAFAIELTSDTIVRGKLTSLPIRGYTNYPANITSTTVFANEPVSTENGRQPNQFDLTVFANAGNMYYLVNDKFVYSEQAIYIQDSFAGFYAYNADVEFTDFEAQAFADEESLKQAISKYVYTVEIKNEKQSWANATLSQIATENSGSGSIDVDIVFRAPRKISDELYKVYGVKSIKMKNVNTDEEVDLTDDFKQNAVAGHYTIKNVPGNIIITVDGSETDSRVENSELAVIKAGVVEKQTGEGVAGASISLYGTRPEDRYDILTETLKYNPVDVNGEPLKDKDGRVITRYFDGYFTARVLKGSAWNFDVTKTGYRPLFDQQLNGGAVVSEDMGSNDPYDFQKFLMTSAVVGGVARSADDARYDEETGEYVSAGDFSVASAPGIYWDLSQEENGKVVFTSTNTGSSNIFYSGKTAAEYQVAYVELTNQTDYMAFSSIEDDPGVGFIIRSNSGSVFCGLRQTGVRILPTSNWSDHIDINGLINSSWKGGIAKIDRNDGGRVQGVPTIGNGSVNRVPVDGQTFTTSFLMIRRGGNLYLYASDGRAGLTENSTAEEMLSKMEPFYHGYIPQAQGVAAIGFAITVSYNLRMDFENYWILAGQEAAGRFADDLISNEMKVEGNSEGLVDIRSDGLLSYNTATGEGRIASDSSINFVAKKDIEPGKAISVSVNGSRVYLSKKDDVATFAMGAEKGLVNIKVEVIDAGTVTGTLVCGDKVFPNTSGSILDPDTGKAVATFVTDQSGKFSALVERNRNFYLIANVNGYAMEKQRVLVTGNTQNLGSIEFVKLNVGERVGTFNTSVGMEYGIDNENYNGAYAHWETDNVGDATLTINPQYNNRQDFVLSFSYVRSSAAANGVTKTTDESDLGLGIVLSGDDASYFQYLNIGTGYRFLRPSWAGRLEQRGLGNVNIANANVSLDNYAQIKMIKKGGMLYLFTKYKNDASYKLIVAHRLVNESGIEVLQGQVAFAIKMTVTSGKYLNLTFFDIKVDDFNEETAAEIYSNVTVKQAQGGNIAVEGQTSDKFRIESGAKLSLTVTPAEEKRVASVLVNGVAQDLGDYKGGVLKIDVTASGNTTITATYTAVIYETKIENIAPNQLNARKVKITDQNGKSTLIDIVQIESKYNESNAFMSKTNRSVSFYLPRGKYTIALCDVTGAAIGKTYELEI